MSNESPFQGIKVLAIDNDPGSLYLIRSLLKNMGCEVGHFDNISEAIVQLQTDHYDICFTDIDLPLATGLQLAKFIRAKISKDMPVVAVTASVAPEDKHICFEAGMTGFLSKPVGFRVLRAELERQLNRKKSSKGPLPAERTIIRNDHETDEPRL